MQQQAAAFGNNRKGTTKATPKIEKYVYYIFTENICSARNPMKVVVFCKHLLTLYKTLYNNDSNFPTLKAAQYLNRNVKFSTTKKFVFVACKNVSSQKKVEWHTGIHIWVKLIYTAMVQLLLVTSF